MYTMLCALLSRNIDGRCHRPTGTHSCECPQRGHLPRRCSCQCRSRCANHAQCPKSPSVFRGPSLPYCCKPTTLSPRFSPACVVDIGIVVFGSAGATCTRCHLLQCC